MRFLSHFTFGIYLFGLVDDVVAIIFRIILLLLSLRVIMMVTKIVVVSIFQVLRLVFVNAERVHQVHVFLCSEQMSTMITVLVVMLFEGQLWILAVHVVVNIFERYHLPLIYKHYILNLHDRIRYRALGPISVILEHFFEVYQSLRPIIIIVRRVESFL